jgi:hypothetical protein
MEAVRTSETSVDNHFTRQYNPEDSSEHHTRRRENLKSHNNRITHMLFPELRTNFIPAFLILKSIKQNLFSKWIVLAQELSVGN